MDHRRLQRRQREHHLDSPITRLISLTAAYACGVPDVPDELDDDEDANVVGKFIVDRATGQLDPDDEDDG